MAVVKVKNVLRHVLRQSMKAPPTPQLRPSLKVHTYLVQRVELGILPDLDPLIPNTTTLNSKS